ncbi:MAG: sigma-54 factor interaction domain-containing protein, partial [Deltaproteobacteria bacterium]
MDLFSAPPVDAENASPVARFDDMIGRSSRMLEIFELIEKVADCDSTILINGETGTGKGLVARAIHKKSRRRAKPFISINCGAIPENLLESELFGHVKGAFTGATTTKPGKFELADGGTVFLDEIGDMSADLQVKVLKVLEEGEFEAVGGSKTIKVDVRIITATHRDLSEEVQKGNFREDLFYRLYVIP